MSQILAKKNCIDPAGSALLNHRLGMAAGAWLSWLLTQKCVCIRNDSPLMVRQCSRLFGVIDHDHDQFDIDDLLSDEQLTLNATYLTLQNEIMFDQAIMTSISGGNFINVNKISTAEEGV